MKCVNSIRRRFPGQEGQTEAFEPAYRVVSLVAVAEDVPIQFDYTEYGMVAQHPWAVFYSPVVRISCCPDPALKAEHS